MSGVATVMWQWKIVYLKFTLNLYKTRVSQFIAQRVNHVFSRINFFIGVRHVVISDSSWVKL